MARLFLDAQHGLCNRLRAMASGASIASRTGRDLTVIWCPDDHCDCRLSDLLIYPGPVIEDAKAAGLIRDRTPLVYNYMEIEEGSCFQAPILEDDPGGDVYIRSAYTLNSPHRRYWDEQAFLRKLIPARSICELIMRVRHPNQVAAHVRTGTGQMFDHLSYESPDNWPAHRHAELTEARTRSAPERFMERIDALIAAGEAETIFLATDLPETYDAFARAYGSRVSILPRRHFDRSVLQLQCALADLMLLTAASRFLASSMSSFSEVAQRLASPNRIVERSGEDF